jgi:hypothetical protein
MNTTSASLAGDVSAVLAKPAAGPSEHVGASGGVAIQSMEKLAQMFDQAAQPQLSLQLGPVVARVARVAGGMQETTANVNNIEGAA